MARSRRAREEVSAGGVVFRWAGDEPLFLLIRDSYRNWGFPKGHVESGEDAQTAALREVREETGLSDVILRSAVDTIDWSFRFRGRLIHKSCHFFLIEANVSTTAPQRAEGITACRWFTFREADRRISYDNARHVLRRARDLVGVATPVAVVASLEAPAPTPLTT